MSDCNGFFVKNSWWGLTSQTFLFLYIVRLVNSSNQKETSSALATLCLGVLTHFNRLADVPRRCSVSLCFVKKFQKSGYCQKFQVFGFNTQVLMNNFLQLFGCQSQKGSVNQASFLQKRKPHLEPGRRLITSAKEGESLAHFRG